MPTGECYRFRMWQLSVNVSSIAQLREAGEETIWDPIQAAIICENAGCDGITAYLREDRRHIKDRDIFALKEVVQGKFNMEIPLADEIISIAKKVKPAQVTLVPEKEEETTVGGGFDIRRYEAEIRDTVKLFHDQNIGVSILVEPDTEAVELAKNCEADFIELHAGAYCSATDKAGIDQEIHRIYDAAYVAMKAGIKLAVGRGLNYENVMSVLLARCLEEVHIGRSIFSRAVDVGLSKAVDDMLDLLLY